LLTTIRRLRVRYVPVPKHEARRHRDVLLELQVRSIVAAANAHARAAASGDRADAGTGRKNLRKGPELP
jgi:hypothetical protein